MSATATISSERGSLYAGLSRQIRAAGLLGRARGHYLLRIAATVSFFAICWLVFLAAGDSWWTLVPAGLLGLVSTQVAFLGHDGGHQQIAASRVGNTIVGLVAGNLLTGLSIGGWADKHNRHHANPNREDHDPDIGAGVLAFTGTRAANRTGRLPRMITAYQAVLSFPLPTLEGLNLHAASVGWLVRSRTAKLRRIQMLALLMHVTAYLGCLLWVLSPVHALAFVALHQAVFGLHGLLVRPQTQGHADPRRAGEAGLPAPTGPHLPQHPRRLARRRTTRRAELPGRTPPVPEHARPHLRRAQRLVRDYCAQHRITYTETGLFGSYAVALRYLHSIGEPPRTR